MALAHLSSHLRLAGCLRVLFADAVLRAAQATAIRIRAVDVLCAIQAVHGADPFWRGHGAQVIC